MDFLYDALGRSRRPQTKHGSHPAMRARMTHQFPRKPSVNGRLLRRLWTAQPDNTGIDAVTADTCTYGYISAAQQVEARTGAPDGDRR